MSNFQQRLKQGTVAGVILGTVLTGLEGVRLKAYPDPATGGKPWTICMGRAYGVHPGMVQTLAQCKADLYAMLPEYIGPLEKCIKVPVPDKRLIALTSLSWNIGPGKVCGLKGRKQPSVADLLNAGKWMQGCEAFFRYEYAAGIYFPGLHKRRLKEVALCVQPISPENPAS